MEKRVDQIFLLGFMGCGKTTIGKLLAPALGWQFVDLDDEVVLSERMPIEQIFAQHGEAYFRRVEADILATLMNRKNAVIALGGGTPTQEIVWQLLQQGLAIYLRCQPEELFRRLRDDNHRPMLSRIASSDRLAHIRNLLLQREPFYLRAEMIIDTFAQHTPAETAAILGQLIREGILKS
ncbi:MAG: shikimate kinase [bacterium]